MHSGIGSEVQSIGASSQGPEAWFSPGSHTTLLGFYNVSYSSTASHNIESSHLKAKGLQGDPL